MLQQTRVAAVLEYYKRFLLAFPTLRDLAEADEQDVLAQWSGLGYYRRARMLHAAAKQLVSASNRIPRSSAELRELPGIGRYTAAAIASIAFGEPTAVVDGNVERVLLRLSGRKEDDPLDFWAGAQELISPDRPGDFNQAMMELGATVCLPITPECGACPVKKWCATRGAKIRVKRSARRTAKLGYRLSLDSSGVHLVQRPSDSTLMAGMWELPSIARFPTRAPTLKVRHAITTTDYDIHVWSGKPQHGSQRVELSRAEKLPLTGLTRKILRRMGVLLNRKA
ncbi:MAG: A/G-specific glycosylase [Acidobacteriales bacterium]|nr:A/G-specific glycosylase [Terriglobales bacterium]